MAEPTQPDGTPDTPTSYGWCAWHQAYASGVRLVSVQEMSGNGRGSYFACHSCRQAYDLVPLADRP